MFVVPASVPQGGSSSLAVSRDGSLLYDSSADGNFVFDSNGITSPQSFAGSSGVLAVSPNDQYVYLASGTGGTLEVLQRNGQSLSVLQTLQDGVNGVRGLTGATGITVSRDNKYVYVTSGSGNSLAIFGVQSNGTLQLDQVIHGGPGLDDPSGVATDTVDDNVYVSSLQGTGASTGGLATFTLITSGPPQPSTLSINYSGMWGLNLTTGVFDDTISEITPATVSDLNVNAGDGNNTVNITDWNNTTAVTTGSGADNVSIHSSTTKPATAPVNVADNPNAVASQSSTIGDYSASNAIDGDPSTFSLTDNEDNSYWEDSLGSTYFLSSIDILFSSIFPAMQDSNFRVSVLSNGKETFGEDFYAGTGGQPVGEPLDVSLPQGVYGDTIKIQYLGVSNLGFGYLSLADVQAFSTPFGLTVNTGAGNDDVSLLDTSSGDSVGINEGTGDDTLEVTGDALNVNSNIFADGGSAPRLTPMSTRCSLTSTDTRVLRQCPRSRTGRSVSSAAVSGRSTT